MKLYDLSVAAFVALLERSKGGVYLLMPDGTAFYLNSKIAQLYAIKMLMDGSPEGKVSPELIIEDNSDREMFLRQVRANEH